MMLEYFALGLLIFVAVVIFYGIIAIHDIPYEIAKSRQHPQQDAIHIAGWISLFTLHTIWPFLWIWATLYRADRGWGFIDDKDTKEAQASVQKKLDEFQAQMQNMTKLKQNELIDINQKVTQLQDRLEKLEAQDHKERP
jgi:hypothetical protein